MRLAYADPPYLGQGKAKYGKFHSEAHVWDDPQAHISLIQHLHENFDGWAFSGTTTSLKFLLPLAPPEARVASWIKPWCSWKPTHRVQYTWEPVIFVPSRPKGGRGIPSVRDYLSANITMKNGLPGAKPLAFNLWILDLLGWLPGDELVDCFPGTYSMTWAMLHRIAGIDP